MSNEKSIEYMALSLKLFEDHVEIVSNEKSIEYMTLSLKLFEDHVEIEFSEKELARSFIKLMGCDPEYILKIFQGAAMELEAHITSSDCIEE